MNLPTAAAIILEIIVIFSVAAGISLIARFSLRHFRSRWQQVRWLQILAETVLTPIRWLIWGVAVLVAAQLIAAQLELSVPPSTFTKARALLIIIGLTWMALRAATAIEKFLLAKSRTTKTDKSLVYALSRLFGVSVYAMSALVTLSTLEVDISALLAVGGLGAFAISWAGKDVVANFFGGLMIYLKRPFSVNDWIKSPNKGFEGIVEEIGWYMTRLRTFDRRPMFVPNAALIDAIIENPGRMYNRRILFNVGLTYDDVQAIKPVTESIDAMLRSHADLDPNQQIMVHFISFSAYSLDIRISCFTTTTVQAEYLSVQQDVLLKIADIVEEAGAQMAFPTQTLHVGMEPSVSSNL